MIEFRMWIALGICLSFLYQVFKRQVNVAVAGTAGIVGLAMFLNIALPNLTFLPDLSVVLSNIDTGGLGLPIGFLAGEKIADRFREAKNKK